MKPSATRNTRKILTFGQFYPGRHEKVIIFVSRHLQNPNLLVRTVLACFSFLEVRGKHFLLTFAISLSFVSQYSVAMPSDTFFSLSIDNFSAQE